MFKKSLLTVSILISMSVTLMGCEDDNGAANAQTCLDKIDDTVALATIQTQVDSCMAYVASDNSQKANVIKCSGYLLRAGLTSPKIVNAVKSLSDSSTHKEAAMIANLGLDDMDSVNTANSYCALTEIEGLIYFSSLTVMGTALKIATGNGSNDNPSAATIQNMVNYCQSNNCNNEVVGTAIIGLGNSYCAGAQSNSEVCGELNQSIAEGGGSPSAVATKFWTLINK